MGILTEKKAIITGASRGIGLAIAKKIAAEGADVVLIARKANTELAEEISKEFGVKAFAFGCDVSDSASVSEVFPKAIETLGGVDILVNNAGITRDGLIMRMKDEDFDDVIRVDLRSVFLSTKAVIRTMMSKRAGSIINISSVNALRGQAGQANYAAAKSGVIGITRSNAMEFAARGITVNAVAPGFIDTDMTAAMNENAKQIAISRIPLQRIGQPEDVANLVAFLASEGAKYITGQIIGVDGGLNI